MSVGHASVRDDATGKVTGSARYSGDKAPINALHAKIVFSDQPHARMLSFDADRARALDGVVAVITSADVPVNEYGLTMFDQPVLIGIDHTDRSAVPSDVSRWEADKVAIVIAETPELAITAAGLIEIEWEQLPLVPDVDAARADDVLVHPEGGESNSYYSLAIRKGDIEAGWAAAEVTIEGTYHLPHQEHAYLQVEAATAWIDEEGRITVETGGQWAWEDQQQIAHALDVDPEQVRVIYAAIGGAFGGKEDMTLQIVLGLAAAKLRDSGYRSPRPLPLVARGVDRWPPQAASRHDRGSARRNPRWPHHRGRGRRLARRRGLQLHVQQGAR